MKSLPLTKKSNGKVTVICQNTEISVHSTCVFCQHCNGIRVNKRVSPNPYATTLRNSRGGLGMDQQLMEGLMLFNTIVSDNNATDIECDDDNNTGFTKISLRH